MPPEIAFLVQAGVDPDVLQRAAALARDWAMDAASVLLATGRMPEDAFYRALATHLGLPFLPKPRLAADGLDYPGDLIRGVATLAPRQPTRGQEPLRVLAPRGRSVAALVACVRPGDGLLALTTPTRLRQAIFAARPEQVAALARDGLFERHPAWACRPGLDGPRLALAGLLLTLCVALLAAAPGWAASLALSILNFGVLGSLVFRLGAAFVGPHPGPEPPDLQDADLPVYTVLVPLYREAAVVPRLVRALARLDYPPAKLDIKLIVEADDTETTEALARVPFPARFEVVVAPPGHPRTKPRALNVALPLARGALLVVYDAEDVPEPGQLRAAAALLAVLPPDVACLQGRLVIDNSADSWLTRCFTLEYTGLFDVIGPALARWHLPFPLGGTSTHFRGIR